MHTQDTAAQIEHAAACLRDGAFSTALQLIDLARHNITVHMGQPEPSCPLPCIDCPESPAAVLARRIVLELAADLNDFVDFDPMVAKVQAVIDEG